MFECPNPARKRHVIDLQPRRRPRQPASAGDGEKSAQIVPVEVGQVCELSRYGCDTMAMDFACRL
jgi:hypothetical protein